MIITVIPVRRVKKQIRSTNCGENPGEASAFFGICALPGAPVASIRPAPALSLMALWSDGAAWSQGLAGQGSSALQLILGANKGTLGLPCLFSGAWHTLTGIGLLLTYVRGSPLEKSVLSQI